MSERSAVGDVVADLNEKLASSRAIACSLEMSQALHQIAARYTPDESGAALLNIVAAVLRVGAIDVDMFCARLRLAVAGMAAAAAVREGRAP